MPSERRSHTTSLGARMHGRNASTTANNSGEEDEISRDFQERGRGGVLKESNGRASSTYLGDCTTWCTVMFGGTGDEVESPVEAGVRNVAG